MSYCLITGVTSDIGSALARSLLTAGQNVLMLNRPSARFNELVSQFKKEFSERSIVGIDVDLADLDELKLVAKKIISNKYLLHALYLNAGSISASRIEQPQGIEQTFFVNAISPWWLTWALEKQIVNNAKVVVTGSAASVMAKTINLTDLNSMNRYHAMKTAYAPSKAAVKVLFSILQKDYPQWQVSVVDLWPVNSAMARAEVMPRIMRFLSRWFMSPEKAVKKLQNAKGITVSQKLLAQNDELMAEVKKLTRIVP